MEIKLWLQHKIAQESGKKLEEIGYDSDFRVFDLDSLSIVSIAFELEKEIKKEINPTLFIEYNTINKIEEWLMSQN